MFSGRIPESFRWKDGGERMDEKIITPEACGFDGQTVCKALGDASRLAILRMLYTEDCYVELIANRLNLTSATVSHHLKKLEEAGLVSCHRTQFYQMYTLNRAILNITIEGILQPIADHRTADAKYEAEIVSHFILGKTLLSIPSQRKKREIVFRYITAAELETGKQYTEKEISSILKTWHEDYCTLRREMVAMGILQRENGIYRLTVAQNMPESYEARND